MTNFGITARAGRILLGMAATFALAGCSAARMDAMFGAELPGWALDVRSDLQRCTDAAAEAKSRALAMGIAPERMQWLYGRKPFEQAGHVSLVIDGWIVVDNGGLGRNVWGERICAGDVCSLDEASRGYDEHFLEPASLALREEFAQGEWTSRIALADAAAGR
jgi:hypothetical protein